MYFVYSRHRWATVSNRTTTRTHTFCIRNHNCLVYWLRWLSLASSPSLTSRNCCTHNNMAWTSATHLCTQITLAIARLRNNKLQLATCIPYLHRRHSFAERNTCFGLCIASVSGLAGHWLSCAQACIGNPCHSCALTTFCAAICIAWDRTFNIIPQSTYTYAAVYFLHHSVHSVSPLARGSVPSS